MPRLERAGAFFMDDPNPLSVGAAFGSSYRGSGLWQAIKNAPGLSTGGVFVWRTKVI
jgi:hypothetical protein